VKLLVEPDAASAAQSAAAYVADRLSDAVRAKGRATVAFSGGSTPAAMFRALTTLAVPWQQVDVLQVDERVVAADDAARNWHSLCQQLADPVDLPEDRRHPMVVTQTDLARAARAYAHDIQLLASSGIDVVHLGLGDDGHTASWPPGDPVIHSEQDVAVVGPYRGHRRMTLTPRVVNHAVVRIWLVSGRDKRHALTGLLRHDPRLPAAAVTQNATDVIISDQPAAADLSRHPD